MKATKFLFAAAMVSGLILSSPVHAASVSDSSSQASGVVSWIQSLLLRPDRPIGN